MITICLSYFNQISMLKYHLETWLKYSEEIKNQIKFLIVDDCSKISIEDIIKDIELRSLNIEIFRVTDDIVCNIAGVRNLSAIKCTTQWMLILDMDTVVSETTIKCMIELVCKKKSSIAYKFNRRVKNTKHEKHNKIHPAVCLIPKEDYWNVGGCDEDLVGHYGQTDPMFWYRAKNIIKIEEKKNIYLDYFDEGNACINRDITHNKTLFESKKKTGKWSTDYIRFNYVQLYVSNKN